MITKKKPIMLPRHKESSAQKARRAKLTKPVPVPALSWGTPPSHGAGEAPTTKEQSND